MQQCPVCKKKKRNTWYSRHHNSYACLACIKAAERASANKTLPGEMLMAPGSKWRHYKGGMYKLLGCCRLEKQGEVGEPHCVYVKWNEDGGDYGEWWCRPLSQWHEEVAPGVRRFTQCEV